MSERESIVLFFLAVGVGVCALCFAIFLGAQSGRLRTWVAARPPRLPVGRYWGFAPLAVGGVTVLIAMILVSVGYLAGDGTTKRSFDTATLVVSIVGGVGANVLSWKMPAAWIPRWFTEWDDQRIAAETAARRRR